MDPFIILKYGKRKYKTQVIQEGGTRPIWNQEFIIQIENEKDTLNMYCYDEDFIIDDFIGLTTMKFDELDSIKLPDAESDKYYPQTIPLFRKSKKSADIQIETKYIPKIPRETSHRKNEVNSPIMLPLPTPLSQAQTVDESPIPT